MKWQKQWRQLMQASLGNPVVSAVAEVHDSVLSLYDSQHILAR
jgi:hypothetical protein